MTFLYVSVNTSFITFVDDIHVTGKCDKTAKLLKQEYDTQDPGETETSRKSK